MDESADQSPAPAEAPLLRVALRAEPDVFVMRQRAREVAAAVGLEQQDQVRVATALSEVGRRFFHAAGAGAAAEVTFTIETAGERPALAIDVTTSGCRPLEPDSAETAAVGRLVDTLTVDGPPAASRIRMTRHIPPVVPALTADRLAGIRATLAASAPRTPLDEMAEQNEQLLAALDQTRRQRDELARLNDELAETNRGVLALYSQLSEELEETNRGVVALYAELDGASARLREASAAKSRFLANVSHELRAPLAAVIGLARLLAATDSDPLTAEQRRQVALIHGSAGDLLALVNGLLDLARAESGTIEPDWSEVDLRSVFGELRGTVRAMATRPEVELVVVDPPPPALIRSDKVLLMQVLRNLLHNGLKFTPRGEVRMVARRHDGTWSIRVSDTGIGIPAELHERIFEEFYQVPGRSAPDQAGTGLGLPYARRLVTLLGGRLDLTSAPEQGSTFTVMLPIEPAVGADE